MCFIFNIMGKIVSNCNTNNGIVTWSDGTYNDLCCIFWIILHISMAIRETYIDIMACCRVPLLHSRRMNSMVIPAAMSGLTMSQCNGKSITSILKKFSVFC